LASIGIKVIIIVIYNLFHTIIKIFKKMLAEHLKDAFPTYMANIKTSKHAVIEI